MPTTIDPSIESAIDASMQRVFPVQQSVDIPDQLIERSLQVGIKARTYSDDDLNDFRANTRARGGNLRGKSDDEVRQLLAKQDLFPEGVAGSDPAPKEVRPPIYGGEPDGVPEEIVFALSRAAEASGLADLARGLSFGAIDAPARGIAGDIATIHRVFGSDEEAARYDQVAEDIRRNGDPGRGFAGLAGRAIGSAIPTAAALVGSGGGSAPAMLYYGITSFGNAGQDYRKEMEARGIDPRLQDEIVHGAGSAAIEIVTERIGLDVLGRIGKRGVTRIGDKMIKGEFASAAADLAIAAGEGAATNAIEEILAEVANNARERYGVPGLAEAIDPNRKLTEGIGEAGLGGAVVGAVFGSGASLSGIMRDGGDSQVGVEQGQPDSPSNDAANDTLDPTPVQPVSPIPAADAVINDDGTVSRRSELTPTADKINEDVGRFFAANNTTGSIVEPETEQQTRIQADAASRGVNVLFVRGEGRLGRPAASPSAGVVLIDADLSPGRQLDAIAWHEMVHEVEQRDPEAWADLNAALSELSPELMDDAHRRYREGWKRETGEDISPEILSREGPSVAAELVIDAIMAEDRFPGTLSRALIDNPTLKEKIINVFQAMLRRLGLNVGVQKLEEARRTKEAARAALLIREAVRSLRGYVPGTATKISESGRVDNTQQSQAVTTETRVDSPDPGGPVSESPKVVFTRNRTPGEFSKRDIRRRLRTLADERGFDPLSAGELTGEAAEDASSEYADYNFSGPIPAEIREALEGQPPIVKMMFKGNVQRGGGEDTMGAIGADAMIEQARSFAFRGEAGVDEYLGDRGDAQLDLLRFLEKQRLDSIEVQDDPSSLPDGAVFEIDGEEFVVYTDESTGDKRMTNGSTDLSLSVESMPIDKGSMRRQAGREAPEQTMDLPFAVREPSDDNGVFGQRMFRSQTGKQNALFGTQEQGESEIAKELRLKQEEDAKRIGDDADQQALFALRDDKQESFGFTRGKESLLPDGRPDLANPAKTESTRRFVNTVDHLRNIAGEPTQISDSEVEARADRMMRLTPGIEQALRDKVDRGGLLDDVETVIAQRLVNTRALEAVKNRDRAAYKEALITTDVYRRSGTLAARAFRQRRDQLKGPAERYREALMGAFLEPDAYVRDQLKKIRDTLMDQNASERSKKAAKKQQEIIFNRESRRIGRVHEDLTKAGLDPRVLTEEAMQDPLTASTVIDIARRARGSKVDALYWVWMNSILSGPLTHAANIIGNTVNLAWRFAGLKGVEGLVGSVQKRTGGDPDFTTGDFINMWKSLGPALSAGYTNMARSWATNRQVFDEQITGEALPSNTFKGEVVQIPDAGPRNKIARAAGLGGVPLKLLMAEDQFFKTIAGVMEAHSIAHRQAVREGLEGDARQERVDELLAPREGLYGEAYMDSDIWMQALEDAKKAVFQDEPSAIGKTAIDLRQGALGPILKWIIPFVRTPDRLFVRGIEASPLGLAKSTLSTAMRGIETLSGVDTSKLQTRDNQAGDIATAISALAILVAAFAWKDDEDGFPRITGSRSPSWRDMPEQYRTAPPLSIRIGDKWYSYARIEPISTGLALTIDILDRTEQGEGLTEALSGSGETLIALTKDKTFIRSIGEIMEAFSDPERADEILTDQARRTFVTAWVPNLFKQTARAANPGIVDNRPASDGGFWTKQAARVPYEALPIADLAPVPQYDIWGRPIKRGDPFGGGAAGFMWRLAVPINVSEETLHPMDLLIWNYNNKVRDGLINRSLDVDGADSNGEIHARPPQRYFTRNGERIDLTPKEYQGMIRNAGEKASERLLAMDLDVNDPSSSDVERIKSVFKREYERERSRIYKERKSR